MRPNESEAKTVDLNSFEKLFELLKGYISNHLELLKLEALDQSSKVGSALISNFLIGATALLFLFFISLGTAFYLSFLFNDNYSGFFILAVFYLVLALILKIFRPTMLDRPIQNKIIETILEGNSTDESKNP